MSQAILKVHKGFHNMRVDQLLKVWRTLSAREIKQLLDAKALSVNGQRVWMSKFTVKLGDTVTLQLIDPRAVVKKPITALKPRIVYEHDDFVVVDKPAGLSVENKNHLDSPLINALQRIDDKKYSYNTLMLVHRLDKDTRGLIVLARNDEAAAVFEIMFAERAVHKTYQAKTTGTPKTPAGVIDRGIERDWKEKNKVKVVEKDKGSSAQTEYRVVSYNEAKNQSLIECKPLTGRMHQIRAHLASIGCPIVGDKIYHPKPGDGKLQLIATHLSFAYQKKQYDFAL
jgi:RluA family pseudouridine synthase